MAGEELFNSCPFTVTHGKGDATHPSEHMGDAFQVPQILFPPKALVWVYCFQGLTEL